MTRNSLILFYIQGGATPTLDGIVVPVRPDGTDDELNDIEFFPQPQAGMAWLMYHFGAAEDGDRIEAEIVYGSPLVTDAECARMICNYVRENGDVADYFVV
jgi:hypothetical protein